MHPSLSKIFCIGLHAHSRDESGFSMVTKFWRRFDEASTARRIRTDARAHERPARAAGDVEDPVERAREAHVHGVPK